MFGHHHSFRPLTLVITRRVVRVPVVTVGSEEGMLRFRYVANFPGIYRFDWGDKVYSGDAEPLRGRVEHLPGHGRTGMVRKSSVTACRRSVGKS